MAECVSACGIVCVLWNVGLEISGIIVLYIADYMVQWIAD